MTDKIIKKQSKQTSGMERELLSANSFENSNQSDEKHELFLERLKTRHGYCDEQALEEMMKIMQKSNKINRNSGFPHKNIKFPIPPVK